MDKEDLMSGQNTALLFRYVATSGVCSEEDAKTLLEGAKKAEKEGSKSVEDSYFEVYHKARKQLTAFYNERAKKVEDWKLLEDDTADEMNRKIFISAKAEMFKIVVSNKKMEKTEYITASYAQNVYQIGAIDIEDAERINQISEQMAQTIEATPN